jgi:thiamine pyrophosphokinase
MRRVFVLSIERAVIFANGVLRPSRRLRSLILPTDLLIAADGGARRCLSLGFTPTVVIGDLDSISPTQRERLAAQGTRFVIHPRDKDQTDLELALSYAVSQQVGEILLLALLGGRLDQTLANLLLLSRAEWGSARLIVAEEHDMAYLLRSAETLTLSGRSGDTISLISLSPQVTSVRAEGVHWPLEGATLHFGSTLSISNEMVNTVARFAVGEGQLLIIHHPRSNHPRSK